MITMDHDCTHCSDKDGSCPPSCYYVKLDEDFRKNYLDFMNVPVSWGKLSASPECPKYKKGDEN